MKKSLLLSLALMLCGSIAFAQTSISGTVVDFHDNPMPGARVQVKGTNDFAIANMDGSFTISTNKRKPKLKAEYVGWNSDVERGVDGVKLELYKTNWWNERPDKFRWFAIANVAFPVGGDQMWSSAAPGIMFGQVKYVGWYVKGQFNAFNSMINEHYCGAWATGDSKVEYAAMSCGAIVRLASPIHLYFGGGYFNQKVLDKRVCGNYSKHEGAYLNTEDALVDMGLMIRKGRYLIQGGFQEYVLSDHDNDGHDHYTLNFGIGYIF